jgi:hypothetical protein
MLDAKNLSFYYVICHIWPQIWYSILKNCVKNVVQTNIKLPHEKCNPWKGL